MPAPNLPRLPTVRNEENSIPSRKTHDNLNQDCDNAVMPARFLALAALFSIPPVIPESPPQRGERPPRNDLAEIVRTTIDTVGVDEPSGIVFDKERQSLFVAGDGGDIAEIPLNGTPRLSHDPHRGDIEGIALDPDGDRLYLIDERTSFVLEVNIENFEILRRMPIDGRLDGEQILTGTNRGAEGIAIVPGIGEVASDRFFICVQGSGDPAEAAPAALIELTPAVTDQQEGADAQPQPAPHADPNAGANYAFTIARKIEFEGARDFADLHYDSERGRIVILSDAENALYLFDLATGEARRAGGLPGQNQEGFTVDAAGAWHIAQDSGGVITARPHHNLGDLWDHSRPVTVTETVQSDKPDGAW